MATFDATWYPDAFLLMEGMRKTVYVVLATPEYSVMSSGDRLEFGSHASITVGVVRRYPSIEALMEREGWQCVLPDAESAEDAASQIRANPEWVAEQETELGVLALRVRDARRK